ncbi:hypothetical protein BC332_06370 [Capsicum chinense]|nr:hypothetical protein BC332_06370 [Capsicum chinense]
MKGVMRFGKKGKLSPRYIGPYKIIQRFGQVAYELDLSQELSMAHPVFHVSMLRKCIGDPSHITSTKDVQVTEELTYKEVPTTILDRQVKKLRNKEVASDADLGHKQQSNKKMKRSIIQIKRISTEEKEEKGDYDYFNKLPTDVIISLLLRCSIKSLSMLRKLLERPERNWLRFASVNMDGSTEELYSGTVSDNQIMSRTMQICYGLVCLSTDCRIYLCNPAMQQFAELPKYSPAATPGYTHCGFGYLHSRKEYKVMHFFYRLLPSTNTKWCRLEDLKFAHLKCEVLTINNIGGGISFSRWEETVAMPSCHPFGPGLLVNERMYWLTRRYRGTLIRREIISFDFENEKFLTISPPSSFGSAYGQALMDLKGMLCLPDARRFRRNSILYLWILKDKISRTWVKEYSIDLVNFGSASYFKTWNEEIIFLHLDTVVFYDLERKCFRGVKCLGYNHTYVIYSESLFSLGIM